MEQKTVFLCAGGTGGHLFPAQALAHALRERGDRVHLVTDDRAEKYAKQFPADETHVVRSATIASRNPIALFRTLMALYGGYLDARRLIQRIKPDIVVGFGGYPTLPPVMAASSLGVPTVIHEQNAVMGRANRFLASRVSAIAGGFLPAGTGQHGDKIEETGNPVRPDVIAAASTPFAPPNDGEPFNLLIFGGSQGAHFFSEVIPQVVNRMDEASRNRLRVTQQARPEDEGELKRFYQVAGVSAEVSPFFNDMAQRIAKAHLVICRSGASTVSEISVIGRPAVLVPYPYALDHDQAANAKALEQKGGAMVFRQSELDPEKLSEILVDLMQDGGRLADMAANAKATGKPDAAERLANLVLSVSEE